MTFLTSRGICGNFSTKQKSVRRLLGPEMPIEPSYPILCVENCYTHAAQPVEPFLVVVDPSAFGISSSSVNRASSREMVFSVVFGNSYYRESH